MKLKTLHVLPAGCGEVVLAAIRQVDARAAFAMQYSQRAAFGCVSAGVALLISVAFARIVALVCAFAAVLSHSALRTVLLQLCTTPTCCIVSPFNRISVANADRAWAAISVTRCGWM